MTSRLNPDWTWAELMYSLLEEGLSTNYVFLTRQVLADEYYDLELSVNELDELADKMSAELIPAYKEAMEKFAPASFVESFNAAGPPQW